MEIITNKTKIEDLENKINYLNDGEQITKIYILYNMQCHFNYKNINYDEKYKLLDLIYYLYMKDETSLNLGSISDTVMGYYKEALTNEITRYNIYDYIESNNNIPLF